LQFGVKMVSKVWSFNGGFNGEEEEEKNNVRSMGFSTMHF